MSSTSLSVPCGSSTRGGIGVSKGVRSRFGCSSRTSPHQSTPRCAALHPFQHMHAPDGSGDADARASLGSLVLTDRAGLAAPAHRLLHHSHPRPITQRRETRFSRRCFPPRCLPLLLLPLPLPLLLLLPLPQLQRLLTHESCRRLACSRRPGLRSPLGGSRDAGGADIGGCCGGAGAGAALGEAAAAAAAAAAAEQ